MTTLFRWGLFLVFTMVILIGCMGAPSNPDPMKTPGELQVLQLFGLTTEEYVPRKGGSDYRYAKYGQNYGDVLDQFLQQVMEVGDQAPMWFETKSGRDIFVATQKRDGSFVGVHWTKGLLTGSWSLGKPIRKTTENETNL